MAPSNTSIGNGQLIPKDLYIDIPRFVDKKTLLEYLQSVDRSNNSIADGLSITIVTN